MFFYILFDVPIFHTWLCNTQYSSNPYGFEVIIWKQSVIGTVCCGHPKKRWGTELKENALIRSQSHRPSRSPSYKRTWTNCLWSWTRLKFSMASWRRTALLQFKGRVRPLLSCQTTPHNHAIGGGSSFLCSRPFSKHCCLSSRGLARPRAVPAVAQFTLDLGKIYDTMTEYAGEMKAGTMSKDSQESLAKTHGFSPGQPQKDAHVVPNQPLHRKCGHHACKLLCFYLFLMLWAWHAQRT